MFSQSKSLSQSLTLREQETWKLTKLKKKKTQENQTQNNGIELQHDIEVINSKPKQNKHQTTK